MSSDNYIYLRKRPDGKYGVSDQSQTVLDEQGRYPTDDEIGREDVFGDLREAYDLAGRQSLDAEYGLEVDDAVAGELEKSEKR